MAQRANGSGGHRYPKHLIFEERATFWWLRGRNLSDFRRLTGLRCDGDAAGLDIGTVYAWAEQLAPLGVRVALARGKQLTTLTCAPQLQARTVTSTAIQLTAELLMDAVELEQAGRRLHLNTGQLTALACVVPFGGSQASTESAGAVTLGASFPPARWRIAAWVAASTWTKANIRQNIYLLISY